VISIVVPHPFLVDSAAIVLPCAVTSALQIASPSRFVLKEDKYSFVGWVRF